MIADVWDSPNNALRVENPDGTVIGAVQIVSSSVTVTTVAAVTTSTAGNILAANANRVGLTIYNNSTANMYVKFGNSASTSNFSFLLGGLDSSGVGDLWDPAIGFCWTGTVTAVWASATGSCQVTEFN